MSNTAIETPTIRMVAVSSIEPNPFQYRRDLELEDMVASVREFGVLQPILLRPVEGKRHAGVEYQLIAGERRWRASVAAHRETVPAIVRPTSNYDAARIAVVENVNREDPPHWATAQGLKALAAMRAENDDPATEADLAAEVGKSLGFIRNHMALFDLPEPLQTLVAQRNDTMSSAFELQKIEGHRDYPLLIEDAREGRAKFRQVRKRVDFIINHQKWQRDSEKPDAFTSAALNANKPREREARSEIKDALEQLERQILRIETWMPLATPKVREGAQTTLRRLQRRSNDLTSERMLEEITT